MKKKATIREVAKHVGVSIATVSRVLNKSPHVSEKTKRKVLDGMAEMNYTPQLTARKLASDKHQMLAVVVPSFTTPYFNEVLKGIKDEIAETDLDMMIYNTGSENPEREMKRFFDRGMADAVIILSIDMPEKVHKQLQATQTPAVLVNTSHQEYDYFYVNDYHGGYIAGEHFAEQGFREVGIITATTNSTASKERQRGFVKALSENEIKIEPSFIVKGESLKHGGFSEEAGFEAIQKFTEKARFPEAIFCLNDTLAIGAKYALSQLQKKVPEDVAVMGYDNIKLSKYHDLTTIDQNMSAIGGKAIKRLSELVNADETTLHQENIEPDLVERGSTIQNDC